MAQDSPHTTAEVLVGAVVLAVAAGFLAYALPGLRGAGAGSYTLKAAFRSVEGISVGTDVRMAGVKVGTVESLGFNSQTYMADARLALRSDIQLPSDSAALVSSEGLLGGAFIEIMPGGLDDVLAPGDEIEDTQGAVSVVNLLMKFAGGGTDAAPAAEPSQ